MTFLLNENVSPTVAQALEALGHQVFLAHDHRGQHDRRVFEEAVALGAIIVTCDLGFRKLTWQSGKSAPGLVLLRLPNALNTAENQTALLLRALEQGKVFPGCFVTLAESDLPR